MSNMDSRSMWTQVRLKHEAGKHEVQSFVQSMDHVVNVSTP